MSGGGMPELGSKISLISKADIRYEGRLYTVDPQECTIALSNVRSFGTEDRDTQFQIAPQSQIYDYILFRGSDIKDIRVINNSLPHHNDPAIMQVQMQNGGQHMMQPFPMQNMSGHPSQAIGGGTSGFGGPFGSMGGLGSGLGSAGSSGGSAGAPGMGVSMAPGAGAPGPFMLGGSSNQGPQQQQQQKPQQQQQKSGGNMLGGGSRSTTPMSLISRKSPSDLMGFQQQLNQQNQQHMQQQHMNQNQQQQQHHQLNQNNLMSGGGNGGHHGGGNMQPGQHKRQNHQQQRGGGVGGQMQQHHRERRDSGRNADNYNNQQQQRHDGRNNYNNNHQRNNIGAPGNGPSNMNHRNWNMHRGGGGPSNTAGNMMRARNGTAMGGGRGGRIQNHQGYRPIGPIGANKPRNQKTTIKFEQDFDFEQANNKFEELRSQLSKLKVGEEQPKVTEPQVNGETDKKEDSGNETGAGDHDHEEDDVVIGYDKAKSFFDNISCEAAQDRSKNKKNDWRQERKLNSETFGVSSTRRGSYRGRNNYYNRNIAGSVGYNRGFRGGNNYRNRINNRTGNSRDNNTNSNASNKMNPISGGPNAIGTDSGAGSCDINATNTVTGTPKTTQSQTPQTGAGDNTGTPNTRSTPASGAGVNASSSVINTAPSQAAVAAVGAGQ